MDEQKQAIIECGALEAWRASLGYEPTEPFREKGGALDPEAWCMKAARAIYANKRPPELNKDLACPQWLVDRIAEAMSPVSVRSHRMTDQTPERE